MGDGTAGQPEAHGRSAFGHDGALYMCVSGPAESVRDHGPSPCAMFDFGTWIEHEKTY